VRVRIDFLQLILLVGLCLKPLSPIAGSKCTQGEANSVPVPSQLPTPSPFHNQTTQPLSSMYQISHHSAPTVRQLSPCPRCQRQFYRRQDRDRHVRAYLPHSIYCPFPRCGWRSDRPENLARHWNTTAHHGPVPAREQCQIYDPSWLVELILDGTLTVERAAWVAQLIVVHRAGELGRGDLWDNPWGRRMRSGQ